MRNRNAPPADVLFDGPNCFECIHVHGCACALVSVYDEPACDDCDHAAGCACVRRAAPNHKDPDRAYIKIHQEVVALYRQPEHDTVH